MNNFFFETDNAKFITDVENGEIIQLKNFVFKKEYVNIPIITIDNDAVFTPIITWGVNIDNQGILKNTPSHKKEHAPIYVDDSQKP